MHTQLNQISKKWSKLGRSKAKPVLIVCWQHDLKTKEEASSPTVSIKAVLLSSVIDAVEGLDIDTVDIPGAFMQVDMRIDRIMTMPLKQLAPETYEPYIQASTNLPFVVLQKAHQGTLQAVMLLWRKLTQQLEQWNSKSTHMAGVLQSRDQWIIIHHCMASQWPKYVGHANTPAAAHLFQTNTINPNADDFHHVVTQLLFLCKGSRPDIQMAVAFQCTHVQTPNTDDKKLIQAIQYFCNTFNLQLIFFKIFIYLFLKFFF